MPADALVLLRREHTALRRAMGAATKPGLSAARRADAVQALLEKVERHVSAESELIGSVLELLPELAPDVFASTERLRLAERLSAEIARTGPDDVLQRAKVTVLVEVLTRNVDDEEQGWFHRVREGIARRELQRIGALLGDER